ncbi:FAD-dependent oxidoreductase [Streptomyces sp. NPDC004542]|uniref:ketopantoate reductase family protein n=1 Tax=Streptomyces sp. NPDC004542 TaxID=3154281 RepID=UPI0033A6C114
MTSYTVVGAGAIGGTLAFHLSRAGHHVQIIDADRAHVGAIAANGLVLAPGTRKQRIPAVHPDDFDGRLHRVLLAVKAQATGSAVEWLEPRLDEAGWVVSLQNGLNEDRIATVLGRSRTVGAFVNLNADVIRPGVVRDGGAGALVLGELDGAPTPRVDRLAADLSGWGPVRTTSNISGYLWAKLAYGAMLTATSLADAPMADLVDRHRPVMHGVARDVCAVAAGAGITLMGFDGFEPDAYAPDADERAADAATDRLVAWMRTLTKNRSGIWRDIAVRKRATEVPAQYDAVLRHAAAQNRPVPVLAATLRALREVETGVRAMTESTLDELADTARKAQP